MRCLSRCVAGPARRPARPTGASNKQAMRAFAAAALLARLVPTATTHAVTPAWTNITLYQIIPINLLSLTSTATADMWLADAFLAAYYDLRGRYGPMACRIPSTEYSEFCTEYAEIMPREAFAVRQLVIEANLVSQSAVSVRHHVAIGP